MQEISPELAAVHIALSASYLGKRLDQRYRLDRFLGEGASACVFAAHDLRLERDVAVKVLKPQAANRETAVRRRFVAEGRTLAKLVHPHVVLVHDAGETPDGLGYLVMELSEEGTLETELCRHGPLRIEEALPLLLPLLGALACAHDRGIVHRDVKPANIVLARERGKPCAKLLDFGIATRSDTGVSTDSAVGTPSYMAPEQARGEPLSAAADVWAMGVVFFRCLSGHLPFDARSTTETLLKLVQERAPLFADACPGLTPHLAVALDRALEPNLRGRYRDMRSFARALAKAAVQDGVSLPANPDPFGLAEFSLWLSDADVEHTRPLPERENAQASAVLARSVPRQRRQRRSWLLAAAILISLAAAVALIGAPQDHARARSASERVQTAPAAPIAHSTANPSPRPHELPEKAAVAPATLTPHAAAAEPTVASAPPKRRSKSKAPVPSTDFSTTPQPSAEPAQPGTKSGVIADWDW